MGAAEPNVGRCVPLTAPTGENGFAIARKQNSDAFINNRVDKLKRYLISIQRAII